MLYCNHNKFKNYKQSHVYVKKHNLESCKAKSRSLQPVLYLLLSSAPPSKSPLPSSSH